MNVAGISWRPFLPLAAGRVAPARIVNFAALCAALCNFTADSNIPRLNLVLVTHAENLPRLFQFNLLQPLSALPVPLSVRAHPVRARCTRLLRDLVRPWALQRLLVAI